MANTFVSLETCAHELGIGERGLRKRFARTAFWPALRVNQIPFYMRSDFNQWKQDHWALAELST